VHLSGGWRSDGGATETGLGRIVDGQGLTTALVDSFNTPFFVPLTTFLEKDWHVMLASRKEYGEMLNGSLKCWRCGQDFGRKLVQLKVCGIF
jgi:hypothetical protein